MSLPLPQLDDRRWADLVEEGRSLIPLHAPEWTDHNVHDPGITLIELLAWVAEMDVYWANRIPAERARKFLALAGVAPHPPRAARTVLAFRPAGGAEPALPAGLELTGTDLAGDPIVLRLLDPVAVVAAELETIQAGGAGAIDDLTARWRRGEAVPLFGGDPRPGAALYLGFDSEIGKNTELSLYFTLAGGRSGWDERQRLLAEARLAAQTCPPPGPVSPCRCEGHSKSSEEEAVSLAISLPPHPSARIVWEMLAGPGVWRPFDSEAGEVVDDTRSLTLDGRVVFRLPADLAAGRVGKVKENFFYLRCRLAGGAWDAAPELAHLAVNGAAADQSVAIAEVAGQGSGEPWQRIALPQAAVQDGKIELTSQEDGETVTWTQRPEFDLSRRGDSHFRLDADRGLLTFGDGEAGRRVPPGVQLTAVYRATRAAKGSLPAGREWQAPGSDVEVTNPVPLAGGAAAETLAEAAARAVELVDARLRAVTLADFEALSLATPGTRLARASARANFDPALPCLAATGVITVLVVPYLPRRKPSPSPGTRRAVAAGLARRRVIGTRVVVAGPAYRDLFVRARVRPHPGTDPADLSRRIAAALDAFFDPLTGGSEGGGWPFGRDVYRSEVLQVLDETPGVDHVLALELVVDGEGRCGNVCLGPTGLVAAGPHEITVEARA
jgi:predicted phage baseplate assembly protein